jgi:molybdate transport system regulatory protein
MRLSLRLDLANGSRLGPGKIALLEAVAAHSSIAAAAREHGMSYRRAWLLIDDMNRAFSEPVVATFPGRSHGAGASLTPFGERLIKLYRDMEAMAAEAAAPALRAIDAVQNQSYDAPRVSRARLKPDDGDA